LIRCGSTITTVTKIIRDINKLTESNAVNGIENNEQFCRFATPTITSLIITITEV
jgi:hypothetical protein